MERAWDLSANNAKVALELLTRLGDLVHGTNADSRVHNALKTLVESVDLECKKLSVEYLYIPQSSTISGQIGILRIPVLPDMYMDSHGDVYHDSGSYVAYRGDYATSVEDAKVLARARYFNNSLKGIVMGNIEDSKKRTSKLENMLSVLESGKVEVLDGRYVPLYVLDINE